MKDRILRFSAMLLLVWYSLSVIGFDVHTCAASGRSFVSTFVSGLSCEDIHPEHDCGRHCHDGGCCSHNDSADRPVIKAESCCSNDYLSLSITGDTPGDKYRTSALSESCICSVNGIADCQYPSVGESKVPHIPDPPQASLGVLRPLLGIWRI